MTIISIENNQAGINLLIVSVNPILEVMTNQHKLNRQRTSINEQLVMQEMFTEQGANF